MCGFLEVLFKFILAPSTIEGYLRKEQFCLSSVLQVERHLISFS